MTAPVLDILLPWKERFEPGHAGALALCVRDAVRHSRYRSRVLGRPLEQPFEGVDYQPISRRVGWLRGRNRATAAGYLHHLDRQTPGLLEIQNRPVMALHIARRRPDIPLLLYLQNDPQEMKAAHTPAERLRLVEHCAAIVCVSDYVRGRFLEGLPQSAQARVHTVITGIERPWAQPPAKDKTLLFVGRVVPVKGVLELARAAARVLPRHPDWSLTLVGAPSFGTDAPRSPYQAQVDALLAPLGAQARATGFLPHDQVMAEYARAAIAAVPSTWHEPLGRTAIEALAAGCALITTDRGGLPEVGQGRALVLPAADAQVLTQSLEDALERLMGEPDSLADLQRRAWNDYPFTVQSMAGRLDDIKTDILSATDPHGSQP